VVPSSSKKVLSGNGISLFSYAKAALLNMMDCCCFKDRDKGRKLNTRKKLKIIEVFQDYTFVLKKINEIDVLKNSLLNDKQTICFDFLNKPLNINEDYNVVKYLPEIYNIDIAKTRELLIEYFVDLRTRKDMSFLDEQLFNNIREELKDEINKRS
jgi:hypothetical protein